jgi:hypothetical protein
MALTIRRAGSGVALIGDIRSGLTSMATGIARAAEIAAGADGDAGEIAAQVSGLGFTGIAQAMTGVRSAIAEIRNRLTTSAALIDEVCRQVDAVAHQISPQQTIDLLRPVAAALVDIHDAIGAGIVRASDVALLAARTLRGGRPGPMLARLNGIRIVLIAVAQRCTQVQAHVEDALVIARRAGADGPQASDAGNAPGRPHAAQDAARKGDLPYHRGFLERLPVRQRDDEQTQGILTTAVGKKISDVASGWAGPGKGGPRLRRPWRNMMSAVDHAEGHAAALMRKHKIREATLYLNNPPCPDIPWGCDRVLPEILPGGSRLTVYGPNGYVKTYEGNGKGVAWP